jgi:hypothetical protein
MLEFHRRQITGLPLRELAVLLQHGSGGNAII